MNITFEEIRDIIEEEVYIGSGTVLGVSDAARAVLARIEAAQPTLAGGWASPSLHGVYPGHEEGCVCLLCETTPTAKA